MEKIMFAEINWSALKYCDPLLNNYSENWQFSFIDWNNTHKVPILQDALDILAENRQLYPNSKKYPIPTYIDGFLQEYTKYSQHISQINKNDVDQLASVLINIQVSFAIQKQQEKEKVIPQKRLPKLMGNIQYDESRAFEYGCYNAKAYLTWVFIIENLALFEKLLFGKNDLLLSEYLVKKLFAAYSSFFPNETIETWTKRFSLKKESVKPIEMMPDTKRENNRVLLIDILKELDDYLYYCGKLPESFNDLIKNNFGFDYKSAKNRVEISHSEKKKIHEFFEAAKKLDM